MKSVLKFWAAISGGLVVIWGILQLYDLAFTNGDGLLGGIVLNGMLGYLLTAVGLLAAAMLGTSSRYGAVANVSASLTGLLFFWIIAEIVCFGIIRFKLTDAPEPFHSRVWLTEHWYPAWPRFWGDVSPVFGRWRIPEASIRLPICTGDTITLSSNRFGMRDRERTLANPSGKKRAVFVGDSFVEGYLVNAPQRYSNLLEAQTGFEHLNFGINGTSPINYYLTYDSLVRRFDHDVVIIGLLPANDFEDYGESHKLALLRYPIYRPYWRGNLPDVTLAYSLADIRQSIAAPTNYHKPEQVQQTVDSLYRTLGWNKKLAAEIQLNSYLYSCAMHWAKPHSDSPSEAEDILSVQGRPSDEDGPTLPNSYAKEAFGGRWDVLEYSLAKLLKAAEGKKVILLGIPILSDLQAYDQNPTDDLSPRLRALCRRTGATYLNLLPVFHDLGSDQWADLYVSCDGHFSPKGERLVAQTLLGYPEYRKAMGLDTGERPIKLVGR